jgi:hypothetical protein
LRSSFLSARFSLGVLAVWLPPGVRGDVSAILDPVWAVPVALRVDPDEEVEHLADGRFLADRVPAVAGAFRCDTGRGGPDSVSCIPSTVAVMAKQERPTTEDQTKAIRVALSGIADDLELGEPASAVRQREVLG